jgi:uncharacterized membrane protein (UPF0127 family)
MASFLDPLLRRSSGDCILTNQRTGAVLAHHLIAAFDSSSRRTGLLRHGEMPAGTAMIIAPSNAIHTFFMRFPIDVAFVGRDGRVGKIRDAVPPWRFAAALRAHAVIELPAGALRGTSTVVGDTLLVQPSERDVNARR